MTDDQEKYYRKGAYDIGLLYAKAIDKYLKELDDKADMLYKNGSYLCGGDYSAAAGMLREIVDDMLVSVESTLMTAR